MKTRFISFLILFSVLPLIWFSSCRKMKELAAVDVAMSLPETYFTYPGTVKGDETIIYSGYVHINLDSILNAYGFSAGIIKDTYFTKLSVTMKDPPGATFSWLSSARGVVANDEEFQTAVEIGNVINSNPLAKTVLVTMNNVNIRPLLDQTDFYLRVCAVLNGSLPADYVGMVLNGKIQFRIEPI